MVFTVISFVKSRFFAKNSLQVLIVYQVIEDNEVVCVWKNMCTLVTFKFLCSVLEAA